LDSYEFEPEGEDVVKVVSVTSADELQKREQAEEEAQLRRELKEEASQPMTDKY
jgi:hypothetical protein